MLTQSQYEQLQAQYERTPHPSAGYSASGEHYTLTALLNKLGYRPNSREGAYELTEKLLGEEYQRDS